MLYSFLTNQSKRALIFLIPGYGSPAAADANIATIFANNGYAVFDIEPEGSIQFNVRLEFIFQGKETVKDYQDTCIVLQRLSMIFYVSFGIPVPNIRLI